MSVKSLPVGTAQRLAADRCAQLFTQKINEDRSYMAKVLGIHICRKSEEPMISVDSVEVVNDSSGCTIILTKRRN